MGRKRPKGHRGPRFAALYDWEMSLPAYQFLTVYGRALLMEFRIAFNGGNNGTIGMSVRHAAALLGCSKNRAEKAIQELLEKGWIVRTERSGFHRKIERKPSLYRITDRPIGLGVDVPETKEFAAWRPPNYDPKKNSVPPRGPVRPFQRGQIWNRGPFPRDHEAPTCPPQEDTE